MVTDSVTDHNVLHSTAFKTEIFTWTVNWTRIAQMVERQAWDMAVGGLNVQDRIFLLKSTTKIIYYPNEIPWSPRCWNDIIFLSLEETPETPILSSRGISRLLTWRWVDWILCYYNYVVFVIRIHLNCSPLLHRGRTDQRQPKIVRNLGSEWFVAIIMV